MVQFSGDSLKEYIMGNTQTKKPLILQLLFLFIVVQAAYSTEEFHRYKIGIIHSYEKNYSDAKRYRQILEEELKGNDVAFETKELFLNCNELGYDDELARASFFIDELDKWEADAVAVFCNQAVYSLLKCDNPRLRHMPVVFCGVYHPDMDLIRQYPNVTGFVDIPDYVRTVGMIERIMGKCRIVVMSGTSMIGREMWVNIEEQCRNANIATYNGDVFSHVWAHRVVKDAYDETSNEFYNEEIDTTVVMRLMSEEMPLRTIQQTARGSETYLMMTSHTYNSIDAPEFFANPSFTAINEGMGTNHKIVGGYFTPLEVELAEMAKSISLRLKGGMPKEQVTQCPKQYILNWNVMQQYGIPTEGLPEEYQLWYIPFAQRYRGYIISAFVLAGGLLCFLIGFLIYSLARERKRKKEALRNLLYEHETLKLAIRGGTTYAWRREKGYIRFDSHFYKEVAHPSKFITLEEILTFVHEEDRERFAHNFLQTSGHTNYREQYRCKFSGEYQWWEFRYSYVDNDQKATVVTGLLQNVQAEKDHEAELIRAREIAEQAELKQSFLNNMSHEIRTPLNSIVGFSNLLVNSPDLDEEEKTEYSDLINQNSELLLHIINDILELSRIDSGAVSFSLDKKGLQGMLNSIYKSFSVQVKPGLEFLLDFPAEDVAIRTDPMRLQQVVINLLTNANKFTAKGYIKLGYRQTPGEEVVRIFVEDTGKGVSADEQELIFSRFYKHDEFAQGTGLGLSICRSIADKLKGHIYLESEEGKGSRFTIELPSN